MNDTVGSRQVKQEIGTFKKCGYSGPIQYGKYKCKFDVSQT